MDGAPAPDIQSLVTAGDGKSSGLRNMRSVAAVLAQDAWDAAGLTAADVPQSYTELLDFLEQWLTRIGETPESGGLHRGYGARLPLEARYVRGCWIC